MITFYSFWVGWAFSQRIPSPRTSGPGAAIQSRPSSVSNGTLMCLSSPLAYKSMSLVKGPPQYPGMDRVKRGSYLVKEEEDQSLCSGEIGYTVISFYSMLYNALAQGNEVPKTQGFGLHNLGDTDSDRSVLHDITSPRSSRFVKVQVEWWLVCKISIIKMQRNPVTRVV
jgi:hypothetical protein